INRARQAREYESPIAGVCRIERDRPTFNTSYISPLLDHQSQINPSVNPIFLDKILFNPWWGPYSGSRRCSPPGAVVRPVRSFASTEGGERHQSEASRPKAGTLACVD